MFFNKYLLLVEALTRALRANISVTLILHTEMQENLR